MVLKAFVYTADVSADVETYTEAEQAYRQSPDGDEVLHLVLQKVAYGNCQVVFNRVSKILKFVRYYIYYTAKTVPEC